MKKRFLSIIMTAAIIICCAIVPAASAASSRILDRGSCGNRMNWELDRNGNLSITGSGAMKNFSYQDGAPWMDNDVSIRSITIDDGITSIGDFAFSESRTSEATLTVTVVRIPNNCNTIGRYAFSDCTSLQTIEIPSATTSIKQGAFDNCSRLRDVYYEGSKSSWNRISVASDNDYLEDARVSCNSGNYNSRYYYDGDYYYDDYYHNCDRYYDNRYYYDDRDNRYYYDDSYDNRYYNSGYSSDRYRSQYSWHYEYGSNWAKYELDNAFNERLVPLALNGNMQKSISRIEMAEMTVMVIEAIYGDPIDTVMTRKNVYTTRSSFNDTSSYVALAVDALGIMSGVGNNKFNPNGTLTRAEAAAITNRLARLTGINTSGYYHNFSDTYRHWSDPELGWPATANIIKGKDNWRFDPDGTLTVEQAIAIVYRTYCALNMS